MLIVVMEARHCEFRSTVLRQSHVPTGVVSRTRMDPPHPRKPKPPKDSHASDQEELRKLQISQMDVEKLLLAWILRFEL